MNGTMATTAKALSTAAILIGMAAAARAETRLTLAQAQALARGRRSDLAAGELGVRLGQLERLRAGLRRVRLGAGGRWSEQLEQRFANAPPALCATVDGLCRPLSRDRVIDLWANLEVPVWTGFTLEAEWARAGQLERGARAEQEARRKALNLEVARAYWEVRLAELQYQSAARALARRSEVAAVVKARFDGGLAPRTDHGRAEGAVLRQRATVAELQGREAEARAELAAALQIDEAIALADDPDDEVALPALATVLASAARRPELAAAQARTEAQAQQVRAVRGTYWPEISLFARAEAQNQALGVTQPGLMGNFSAGVQASWQALDGFLTWQAVQVAEVERDRLVLEQERLRHLVDAEVRRAHARLAGALAQRRPLAEARALAETTVALTRRRYQAGTSLLIELLDAEDELAQLDAAVVGKAVEIAEAQAALAAAGGEP